MKNNQGFTLIELLAVVVVLAIVAVLGTSTVMPLLGDAREQAFRTEATNVITSAEDAIYAVNLGEKNYANNTENCKKGKKVCFTIKSLIDWGLYKGDADTYKGKVEVDVTNPNYDVTLYLKRGAEFAFVGENYKAYKDNGSVVVPTETNWISSYETCSCE